jgi:hypothetical protein
MPPSPSQVNALPAYKPEITRVILGFFDVLGFSKRVETEGPEKTAALYHTLIETTVKKEAARALGLVSDGTGNRYPAAFSLDVQTAYFSDTIFMWVPLERVFADAFVSHCATFVCEALNMGVPIRGAIALGEAVMDRGTGTYIGMPIVEGAACEKVQEWLGVAFAPSATWQPFLAEVSPNSYIEYDIPIKSGHENDLPPIALDWSKRWEELFGTTASAKLAELNAAAPHSKISNAMDFAEFCQRNRNLHEQPAAWFDGKRLKMSTPDEIPPS